MSTSETTNRITNHEQHKIIFADRDSLRPNENDTHIKQLWIDIYNENLNEGAVQSNGTILWDCPCLGTQAIGPCSSQFRSAFACYQNSSKEPKAVSHIPNFGDARASPAGDTVSLARGAEAWASLSHFLLNIRSGSECMAEFMKMQTCFNRYPKLYNNNSHSNKANENESNMKPMNHPEARRHRINEARKANRMSDKQESSLMNNK